MDLGRAQLVRVPLAVVHHEAVHPLRVRPLRAQAEMLQVRGLPDAGPSMLSGWPKLLRAGPAPLTLVLGCNMNSRRLECCHTLRMSRGTCSGLTHRGDDYHLFPGRVNDEE